MTRRRHDKLESLKFQASDNLADMAASCRMLNISPKLPPPRDIQTFFSISLEFHTKTRDIEIRTSADRSDWTVAPDSRVWEKRAHVGLKAFRPAQEP